MQSKSRRKIVLKVHRYSGLIMAIFLIIAGIMLVGWALVLLSGTGVYIWWRRTRTK